MIKFSNINKEYQVGNQVVKALSQVNFEIEPHQLTVILGPSGSGKSTLLNILGGMVWIDRQKGISVLMIDRLIS